MPISRKTTVAQGFFHKIYQKQPIEVPLILLTTKTNIGKLKVARSFLAQRSLSDMRTLFWSNMVNLNMSSHFWPNKPIEEIYIIEASLKMSAHFWSNVPIEVNLQLRALFLTILSFLTKVANFKENDSCPVCFDAIFEQQASCTRCFAQVLAF